ncbi:TIGR02117 family protein [soil metagenome]
MKLRNFLFFIWLISIGCLGPVRELYPEDEAQRPLDIFLVSHGWHVGIAIETAAIEGLLPDHEKMPQAQYLKFGWGDHRYYTDRDAGFWLAVRAALLPTRSVIHVVGIDMPIDRYFSSSDVIRVKISEDGAENFAQFVADRFRLDDDGSVIYAAEGLYTNSAFFKATGFYYLPKTSNTWTARALRQTGYPITPFYAFTSGNVIQQARKDGEVIQMW